MKQILIRAMQRVGPARVVYVEVALGVIHIYIYLTADIKLGLRTRIDDIVIPYCWIDEASRQRPGRQCTSEKIKRTELRRMKPKTQP